MSMKTETVLSCIEGIIGDTSPVSGSRNVVISEYDIMALREAVKALEKQTPKREKNGEMYWCGNCKAQPNYDDDLYCANCGQRLSD